MTGAPSATPLPPLARPLTSLYGVGPERAAQLARLDIRTVHELLLHRPRRYEDRRRFKPIAELQLHEAALTRGKIVAMGVKWFAHHTKSIVEIILDDGTARLHCRWWNLPYMEKYFQRGDDVVLYGKLLNLRPRTIDHPETEVLVSGEEESIHMNRITPIYPLTEGLPQRWLRSLIWRTVHTHGKNVVEPWPEEVIKEALPGRPLPSRAQAIRLLHSPAESEDAETARQRLALDEFVALQVHMQRRRKNFEAKSQALPAAGDNRLIKPFLAALGYKLTAAQTRVLKQLRKDMGGRHPMRRLLQGDVGSGKTVVAACCALMALESGYHVALMAPTEILAEQHYRTFSQWLEPLGVPVALRTGGRKTQAAAELPLSPASASNRQSSSLSIGTHALLESGFSPDPLGLVIIDEQHKFGVAQREQLVKKGNYPHLLVMTATPIPRTLGLTLYGDLDVSVLDELPPGRGRIKTYVRRPETLPKVWEFLRAKLGEGRQAYVVYPRVEESSQGVKAVTKEYGLLKDKFAPFQVGLLHGKLPSRQKDEVMTAFRQKRLQVLLATSLVEVGVDVPNATILVIENAEQFGLAQLHQLRGRIGRGAHDSHCILVAGAKTPEAQQRLKALEETPDGFKIAEVDLQIRGPGELLGQEQSGTPKLRFGDLRADLALINAARRIAATI